jgi:hypothetical protein
VPSLRIINCRQLQISTKTAQPIKEIPVVNIDGQ